MVGAVMVVESFTNLRGEDSAGMAGSSFFKRSGSAEASGQALLFQGTAANLGTVNEIV